MRLITNEKQLVANIETVEKYLVEGSESERTFIRDLIRRGKCFVAYEVDREIRMAPSRFLGYVENNVSKHEKARKEKIIDGRETNPVISDILNVKLQSSVELEKQYLSYCNNLSIIPADYDNRRYWMFKLEAKFGGFAESESEFPEGKIVERIHKARERNPKVIVKAKEVHRARTGTLTCQACGFDFEKTYGKVGKDFIECHHIVPVSEMAEGQLTRVEDIALLCANCHRMIHKKRPWLSMSKLKLLFSGK